MSLFLALVGRLIVVVFALGLALLGASMVLAFGITSGVVSEFLGAANYEALDESDWGITVLVVATVGVGLVTSFQLAGLALLPIVIAVVMCEIMRWQGLTINLILSGLCALFVMFTQLPEAIDPAEGTIIITLAMGFVGGFVYWLVAGRAAGNWLGKLDDLLPPKTTSTD